MPEIKPCRECGAKAKVWDVGDNLPIYAVRCENDHEGKWSESDREAVENWNNTPDEIKVEWSEGDEKAAENFAMSSGMFDMGRYEGFKGGDEEARRRCIEIVREAARDQWKMGTGGYAEIIRRIAKGR